MITNLTNTRWVLNYNNLDLISNNPHTHYIDFISNGKEYSQFKFGLLGGGFYQLSYNSMLLVTSYAGALYWNVTDAEYREIYITGGEDAGNGLLIDWFEQNAVQIPSHEEKDILMHPVVNSSLATTVDLYPLCRKITAEDLTNFDPSQPLVPAKVNIKFIKCSQEQYDEITQEEENTIYYGPTSFQRYKVGEATKAFSDEDGNNLKATYATKTEVNQILGDLETALEALL